MFIQSRKTPLDSGPPPHHFAYTSSLMCTAANLDSERSLIQVEKIITIHNEFGSSNTVQLNAYFLVAALICFNTPSGSK